MPLPRGTDPEKAVFGYMQALQGLPVEAIAHGIRRFLRGECKDISNKFCPHPPELAAIVRGAIEPEPKFHVEGRLYGYHPPRSKVVERKCTKDWARQLVHQGIHPRGSIWCPGEITGKPEIGDLFGPDPWWRNAVPLIGDRA